MNAELRAIGRYTGGLRPWLRSPLGRAEAQEIVRAQVAGRAGSFLAVLRRAVWEHPASPYLPQLRTAGVEWGDVAALVERDGLEVALGRLYDAGIRTPVEDFKDRAAAFDNPLLARQFEIQSTGSGGAARRMPVDLDLITHEAAEMALYFDAHRAWDHRIAQWRAAPPAGSGIKDVLRHAKLGLPTVRWWSHTAPFRSPAGPTDAGLTAVTIAAARLWGPGAAVPRHVPPDRPDVVARWVGAEVAAHRPVALTVSPTSAVKVAAAAADAGLDLTGAVFRLGGEPFTPARAAVLAAAGIRASGRMGTSETGVIALPCAEPQASDDLHLLTDKVAVITRPAGLVVTTLLTSTTKVLLNVELGDEATVADRPCGCAFGRAGLTTHISGIASARRLTADGMTFGGRDLLDLVDRALPARFGGSPGDYQLVEEEGPDGVARIVVRVSGRVGAVDEESVRAAVVAALASGPRYRALMAGVVAALVRVSRDEPIVRGHKVPPIIGLAR